MSTRELEGRIAVVTGGSKGIGRAIAERLCAAGATSVLAARSITAPADDLAGTAQDVVSVIEGRGGKAEAIACDVEDAKSREFLIQQVIKKFGRIDILVNNAGRAVLQPVMEMDFPTSFSQTQQYFLAPLHLSLLAIPHMKRQGQGWIVNLGSSSVTSYGHEGERGLALYGALKSAVHRFTTGFAFELKEHNIAVNVVTPVTMILTGGTESLGLNSPEMQPHHERVEHIAEATLALVAKPPREQTGVIAWSHQYLDQIGRSTMSLDGATVIQKRG